MKCDMTGKTSDEVNREALRLSEKYGEVEVVEKDGKVTILCTMKRKTEGVAG